MNGISPQHIPSFNLVCTMSSTAVSSRAASYKKGIDGDNSRRNREATTISIRKAKREEGMQKRRGNIINNFVAEDPAAAAPASAGGESLAPLLTNLPALTAALGAGDKEMQLQGIRGFRKVLSKEENPPVDQVIGAGVLPHFVALLMHEDDTIKFEAAWALTNIASTARTTAVVECGAVPSLVQLLMSTSADVREQCAWCLGNIAGDSPQLRDQVLGMGALQPLLCNIAQPASESMLRNATWALSNFCRGKPQPDLEAVRPAIPALLHLFNSADKDVLMDAGWALSYLSDGGDDRIQAVVEAGVVPSLVQLLGNQSSSVVTPALRSVGNIVSGNEMHTQAVVDHGGLQTLLSLLENPKKAIRKETCWALSNVAAGTPSQINSLMGVSQLIPGVMSQLQEGEWDVRKEAAWVISNVATGGTAANVQSICDAGAINGLCELLTVEDAKVVMVSLDALEAILKHGEEDTNEYAHMLDECDGLEKIEGLQEHENTDVYEKAVLIIETFFGEDEDNEDGMLPQHDAFTFGEEPAAAPEGGFNFNFE
jgi:HEAT repeat protein